MALINKLKAIANAIRSKTNKTEELTLEQMASEIEGLDGREAPENDVIFYDYDGKRLYSFSWNDFQLLEEMPPLPSHEGLICEGWNWTLEEVKQANGWCEIGALYITDNGATRLYIDVISEYDKEMQIWWSKGLDAEAKILWGDGTETIVGDEGTYSHTYDNIGKYCIEIFGGRPKNNNSNNIGICGENNSYRYKNIDKIYKVELGENFFTYNNYAFANSKIKTITTPKNLTLGISTFLSSLKLGFVVLNSNSVQNTCFADTYVNIIFPIRNYCTYGTYRNIANRRLQGNYYAYNIQALTHVFVNARVIEVLNLNITTSSMFANCMNLVRVVFHEIKNISSKSFNGCISLKILDFSKCTTIPTLDNVDAFGNTNDTFEILVPNSLYDQWIATANWAEYAEQIKGV